MHFATSAVAAFSALTLASAQTAPNTPASAPQIKISQIHSTTYNGSLYLVPSSPNIAFVPNANYPTQSINSTNTTPFIVGVDIKDRREFKVIQGVGAGVSDSASIVLQDLKNKNSDAYWALLRAGFDQSAEQRAKGGAAMSFIRITLGASDFGFQEYTYDDTTDGSPDLNLTLFNINKGPKMWATLKDIVSINPTVKLVAVPYTAPAWMKTNGRLRQGSVKEEYEEVWSRYLCRAMTDIKEMHGIDIHRLSLQNEPLYEAPNYPSGSSTPEQQARIGKLVRTCLDSSIAKNTKLLAYDHNWNRPDFPIAVFDKARDQFEGVAWHCFEGNPEGQQVFNRVYQAEVIMTQCTRGSQFFDEPWSNLKRNFAQYINGSIGFDADAIILWNLALKVDKDGFTTPVLPGAANNNLAPFLLYDNVTGTPANNMLPGQIAAMSEAKARRSLSPKAEGLAPLEMRQIAPPGGLSGQPANVPVNTTYFRRTSDYATLTHLTLAIRPRVQGETQGRRIGIKTTEDFGVEGNGRGGRIAAQAFRTDNADKNGNSRFSVILLQQQDFYETGPVEDATVSIRFRNAVANVTVGPGLYNVEWFASKDP